MAVSRAPEQIKSTPNVSLLNTFSGYTVTVTKHRAPRGSVGNPVVTTQRMALDNILALQTTLPLQHGPGYYRFEVVDSGGTGSDTFMQQLGGDVPDIQEASMAVLPGGTSNGAAPTGPDIVHLGNGFYYNSTMKLLTTPWRKIYPWEEGQPMPEQPAAAPANPFMQAAATPWNAWSPPGSGWGGFPVNDDSAKVKEMQARIDEDKRQREMQQLRDEVKANNAQVSAAIEKLALALSAKPAGPSETEQMLKRELDDEKRRREQSEREDRIRSEMRMAQERVEAQIAAITAAPKTDPMMPMLLQLIASVQSNASETVKSIQAATQSGMASSERSTQLMLQQLSGSILSPLQLTQLMTQARGDAGEAARHVIEAAKDAMAMQKDVFSNLLELSSQGDQPAWLQAVRELSGTVVGPLGNMLAQRQQQQQAPQQPVRRQMAPQQMRQPPAVAMPGAPMQAPPPALPAARASDAAHHQRTFVAPTQVEDVRSRAAASISHFQQPPTSPGSQGADVTLARGSGGLDKDGGVMAGAVLAEVTPSRGSVTPIAAAPKKPPRARKKNAAPPPPPPVEEPVQGFTMDQMRDADPDVLREMVALLNDEQLFGITLAYVEQLRASGDPPEKLAESILASRQYITSFGGVIPPGMELLIAQQTVVLVERLLPEATDELRAAVVEEIDAALEVENGGAEEEDEEEDDEEEGDEVSEN